MTSRFFLTLLALLTGLAAQPAQVQARMQAARTAEIGLVTRVAEVRQEALRASLSGQIRANLAPVPALLGDTPVLRPAQPVANTRIGVDRARE